jgi:hypothetical protein
VALLCLMWCLWRERNARSFEDIETSVVELKRIMFNTLYTWISTHHSFFILFVPDTCFIGIKISQNSGIHFSCLMYCLFCYPILFIILIK